MSRTISPIKVGLVVNPTAGIGGPAGFRGSDDPMAEMQAKAQGYESKIAGRLHAALLPLKPVAESFHWFTCSGAMGANYLQEMGFDCIEIVYETAAPTTTAQDTQNAVFAMQPIGVDVLLFAGGDGTARDVLDVIGEQQVALGVPCGVKMHSGVFARHPAAVGDILLKLRACSLVSARLAEVRDIDEAAFQLDRVITRHYGDLLVPDDLQYVQSTKVGGTESEPLVLQEIAADFIDHMDNDRLYFMGGGRTVGTIMEALGLPNSLLGVDVIKGGQLVAANCSETSLKAWAEQGPASIVVSVIGGQGHIFGRGNQQIGPAVIRAVGLENIIAVATKSKLEALPHGVIVDTGDLALDKSLSGLRLVQTGYEDAVLVQWSGQ